MLVKFENATITSYLGFVFEENLAGRSHDYREAIELLLVLLLKSNRIQ